MKWTIIQYYLMKKLNEKIINTKAFELGLINEYGELVRKPNTNIEKSAYTPIDKYIFKLRKLLGDKLDTLNHELYLEHCVKNASTDIATYDTELTLKNQLNVQFNHISDILKEAKDKGLKEETIDKIMTEILIDHA